MVRVVGLIKVHQNPEPGKTEDPNTCRKRAVGKEVRVAASMTEVAVLQRGKNGLCGQFLFAK